MICRASLIFALREFVVGAAPIGEGGQGPNQAVRLVECIERPAHDFVAVQVGDDATEQRYTSLFCLDSTNKANESIMAASSIAA
jgi:hypothetical protein